MRQAVLRAVGTDVPVLPDAPTARRWALDELANPEYHRSSSSLLRRLLDRVWELLSGIHAPAGPAPLAVAVVVVAALLLVFVVLRVAGPVRRARALPAGARSVLSNDDTRTAEQLRAAADAAAARQDWSLAVLERFRALVRDLEERTVLDERVGRTAHDAAVAAGLRLPVLREPLVAASRLFDDVAYGDGRATVDDERVVRALEQDVRRARPARAEDRDRADLAVPR